MGGAGGRGGPCLNLKNLRTCKDLGHNNNTPFTPCGVGADLKASPLPPAPLVTSRFVSCNLNGFAGFERSAGVIVAEIHKINRVYIHVIGLGHDFGSIWGSWGTILVTIGCKGAPRRVLECPNMDLHRFLMNFGGFWDPSWKGKSSQDRSKIDPKRHRKNDE